MIKETIESIRLLKDLEEKIENQILNKFLVNTNMVNFTLAFRNDVLSYKLYLKIKINDEVFQDSFSIVNVISCDELLDKIKTWIAEKIIMEPLREICIAYASGKQNNYTAISGYEKEE